MDRVVSYGDVVVRSGMVTDYAWRQAARRGALKPLKVRFAYKRRKYLASHVERVFGLTEGSLRGER